MDYLEGALLGPVWSDTDYENRSHKGAAILISAGFWVGFTYLLLSFYADNLSPWLQTPSIWLITTLVAVLITPILCFYYYNLPLLLRFFVLAFQLAKYVLAVLIIYSWVVPAISLNFDSLLPDLLEWSDSTVGTFVERNTEVYELFGLLVSGIVLVLVGAIAFILSVVAIVMTPILYVQIVKYVQRLFDLFFLSLMKQIRRLQIRYRKQDQLKAESTRGSAHVTESYEAVELGSTAAVQNPEIRRPEGIRHTNNRKLVKTKKPEPPESFQ